MEKKMSRKLNRCSHCETLNPPTAEVCEVCGQALLLCETPSSSDHGENPSRNVEDFCQLKCFSMKGRLGRLRFMIWTLVADLIFLMFMISAKEISVTIKEAESILLLGLAIIFLIWLIFSITIYSRRLHDMNLSSWYLLLFAGIIMLAGVFSGRKIAGTINFFIMLSLCGKRGSVGANSYGLPPPPHSPKAIAAAWAFILISSAVKVGILSGL
jgi:uncharacterized membrane protein YhaH (DUF805 family)